jgi:hypothetical protein
MEAQGTPVISHGQAEPLPPRAVTEALVILPEALPWESFVKADLAGPEAATWGWVALMAAIQSGGTPPMDAAAMVEALGVAAEAAKDVSVTAPGRQETFMAAAGRERFPLPPQDTWEAQAPGARCG